MLGRGSADVIVQQDEILIRAGKFKGTQLQPNVPPVANPKRGFLQISRFNKSKNKLTPNIVTKSNEITVQVKYLIEWVITNPENMQDVFSGTIYLYQLKANLSTNSKNLTVDSVIDESFKSLLDSKTFSLKTKNESIDLINDFIKEYNGKPEFLPLFYRPNKLTYAYLIPSSPPTLQYNPNYSSIGHKVCLGGDCNINLQVINIATSQIVATSCIDGLESAAEELYQAAINEITTNLLGLDIEEVIMPEYTQLNGTTIFPPTSITSQQSIDSTNNISYIFNKVKLNSALKQGGYGLIYVRNRVGKPLEFISTEVPQEEYTNDSSTYGAVGAGTLYLLSHNSAIPGKGQINFNDTLYGISLDKFVDELLPKTSSLVRGEELLELLNLIVRFLNTHTHAYPGTPPVPITQDGTSSASILTEMQNAYTKILNENIRLN